LTPPESHYLTGKGSWGQPYSDQWGLEHIGFDASADSAWRLVRSDAKPVIVALIDTGLDWFHRDIDWDNIWKNPGEIPGNRIDDDKNGLVDDIIGWDFQAHNNKPWDYDGHGTFVAGIIAASWKDKAGMAGINPFAKLMILKAVNNFGHTRASFVAEAIVYAADKGARVINLSVGGKNISKPAMAAIDYAYGKGCVIVVAAGNEGVETTNYGLAASNKVLVVAATGHEDERAAFSNWGNISVAAPGVDILSLRARRTDTVLDVGGKYQPGANFVGADKRYYRASGTSFAAPIVTGLASLMIANDPTLTNKQVMNIIKSTARDVGTPGVNQFTGYGLIDARAALKAPKDYFLFADISGVEVIQKDGNPALRVRGTADANALKGARLEIAPGENPTEWKSAGSVSKTPGPNSALGEIPASAFAGAKLWYIRVVVDHNDGRRREARFKLSLG
jgi:subtilisin family serine protease